MGAKDGAVSRRQVGEICYQLTRRRVKNLNLRVRADGTVAVSIPLRVPAAQADPFVACHAAWIEQARQRAARRAARPLPDRQEALDRFTALVEAAWPAFASRLGPQPPAVRVRAMTSRWGVCAPAKRQVTFALALYGMPLAAQEYVVVHELCHLLVPGHSPAFWEQVARRLPDWKARRALLRDE